jgi:WD40 repeat protein
MSQQLDYQECYRKAAHESIINTMVLSPDGCRLITGSSNSTLLIWSTQSGSILCCIKSHSPVLSLAWLKNSNGFLFGCENGMLASFDISEVCASVLSLLLTHADTK